MSNRARLRDPARHNSRLRISESATTPVIEAPKRRNGNLRIDEANTGGAISPTGGLRYRARLIEGDRWGSSGYYPRKVVERDGPKVWPAGTLMFLDHPTPTEEAERPVRSVKDVGGRIVSTPTYDGDGLYADIEVFPHAAPLVESMVDAIGLSVRGEGAANWGTKNGREGWIVENLSHGDSVDFVTKAGAGGKIMSLLESARSINEARNIGAWLESRLHLDLTSLADDMYGQGRLTRDERIVLSNAIGDALTAWTADVEANAPQLFQRDLYDYPDEDDTTDASTVVSEARIVETTAQEVSRALSSLVSDTYGGNNKYVWVRDYDPDRMLVWFDVPDSADCDTYQQSYAKADDGTLSLVGDRVEVVVRTVYSPISSPDGADVAESQTPPVPAGLPVAEGHATSLTDGNPPAVTSAQEEVPAVGTESTGPAPGAAGPADGGAQTTSVNEAALSAQLRVAEQQRDEAVARATALTEARNQAATATAERDRAIAESRALRANDAGRTVIARMVGEAANVPANMRSLITPRVAERVIGRVPLTEATGEVDMTALEAAITAAIETESTHAAAILEAAGAGRVAGLGGTLKPGEMSEADFERGLSNVFSEVGLSESEIKLAVKGR